MVTFSGHTTTPTSSRYYVGSFNPTPRELSSGCQTYLYTYGYYGKFFLKALNTTLHLARPERIFTSVYLDDLIIFGKSQKLTANHTKQAIGKFSQLVFTYRTTKKSDLQRGKYRPFGCQ
ncbi:hypothetical protein V8B55DRAFT_1436908 [Mucor lusitanicus]|uniref:Uncharacterized protein n=2 Tax=Mucor circinelloides f. lusitanicus TaxID=29924 RepID=A0A168GN61_MUCCL|nr:hypothetical protein FB192DRAFT_1446155 [Mucor lusitanicus]OAC97860.1 hypothetical protein MUCCIDRAFT_168019 [Mucor lusitanicus CBS 277.49]